MQAGLEARSDAPSQAPEPVHHPEPVPRRPHDRLRVAAVLPLFLVVAALEIAWLLLLVYAAHRFVLQPILEY
jgi:hypothetical protein